MSTHKLYDTKAFPTGRIQIGNKSGLLMFCVNIEPPSKALAFTWPSSWQYL